MSQKKDSIIHSFEKCWVSVRVDKTSDDLINIHGLEHYQVGLPVADVMRSDESDSDESLFEMDPSSDLENLYILLSNVIGQLLDSNALRVLWISI